MGLSLPRSLRGGGPYAPPRQHAPEGVTSARQSAGVRVSAAAPRRWVRAGTSAHALGATEARAARGAGPADTEAEGIPRVAWKADGKNAGEGRSGNSVAGAACGC